MLSSMEIWCEFPAKSVRPNYFYDVFLRRPLVKIVGLLLLFSVGLLVRRLKIHLFIIFP